LKHVKSNRKRLARVPIFLERLQIGIKKEVQIDFITIGVKKEEEDIYY